MRLEASGFAGSLLMMLSDGLVETLEYCIPRVGLPHRLGTGGRALGRAPHRRGHGAQDILSVDMGGTSFDICMLRDGEIPTTTEAWVQDERVAIKMVDIQSGGAGGGSIAWIDQLGLLRVGPMSAGGDPGPACYGKGGTAPTVTDADLVLGYVPADYFLGGEIALDADAARRALDIGRATRSGSASSPPRRRSSRRSTRTWPTRSPRWPPGAATTSATSRSSPAAARARSTRPSSPTCCTCRGWSSRRSPRRTRRSGCSRWTSAGTSRGRTSPVRQDLDLERVRGLYAEMEARGARGLRGAWASAPTRCGVRAHGRHALRRPVPRGGGTRPGGSARTERRRGRDRRLPRASTRQLYTFDMPWQQVELLTFRVRATTPRATFDLHAHRGGRPRWLGCVEAAPDRVVRRPRRRHAGLRRRAARGQATRFPGPALIEEATTTVVVPARYALRVDALAGLRAAPGDRRRTRQ